MAFEERYTLAKGLEVVLLVAIIVPVWLVTVMIPPAVIYFLVSISR